MFWFDFHWQIQHFLNQLWWPVNFLLLINIVILGYLSYKKPTYAVGLTIILLPTYLFRSKIWFLPLTYLEICIWTTFLGWVVSQIIKKEFNFNQKNYGRLALFLILLSATIALLISPDIKSASGLWKAYFIEPILFFLVLINNVKSENDKRIILWALGIATLPITLLAIYQKITGFAIFEPSWTSPENRRVTSLFSSPNAIGLFIGPIMAIYGAWLIADVKKVIPTITKLLILLLALMAVIFTASSGTMLGLTGAAIFLLFFGWNKKLTSIILIGLTIITLAIPISREKIWPIITLQDASGRNRIELAMLGTNYLTQNIQNFILGAGILGFDKIQDQARDPLKIEDLLYPHNIILNFWLEIGIIGLIGFIYLITQFFKTGFQNTKPTWITLGIMAAMITVLVHGLVDVPYFKNDLAVLFWIIIGLI